MLKLTLKDGSVKTFDDVVTGFDVAKSISNSLAKRAVAIRVDDKLQDLYLPIENDSAVDIVTSKDEDGIDILRHDTAHILAQAVQELFDDVQVTIGPVIDNGFYYDFARKEKFTPEDLPKIEAKMAEIIARGDDIRREVWERDKAVNFFLERGEKYKAEIIGDLPKGEEISLYRQGDFIDLCRGPHAPSTAAPKAFKLTKIAGAYWRGNSKNEMLQRIYGVGFADPKALKQYLHQLAEAEKRDHRKIGKEMDLFHFQEEAAGQVFWHDKGLTLYRGLENYIRDKIKDNGYAEVKTPMIVDRTLWERSGHWEKFGENMFTLSSEDRTFAIKPMNCPGHVQIFNQKTISYKDLPIRMAEFGTCHRNESSGSLHGLMRVRAMIQDDAHIFCTEEQIVEETKKFCNLLQEIYKELGFEKVDVKLSTRPEKRAGSDEVWDKAEQGLAEATKAAGLDFSIEEGEGAFYGPKLEFHLVDAIGRTWQCGTLQLDFVLPERLGAFYVGHDNAKHHPVMLHRAILGSLERFLGILIEHYEGKFPLWLAPVQVVVTSVINKFDDYAKEVFVKLKRAGFRVELDTRSDKISYKVREHSLQKIPVIMIVGEKEMLDGSVSVRRIGSKEQKIYKITEILESLEKEIEEKK